MSKGNRGPAASGGAGGDGVSHPERDELLAGDGGKPARRRKRRKHRWLKRTALALLLLVVLLGAGVWFFGPALAEKYAPGIIARQSREQIRGGVEVGAVSLSWTKGQEARTVRLLDPAGEVVADLNASIDRGLIGLATNWTNLGVIDLDGRINIVSHDDGTTNLQRAIEPTKPRAAGGAPGTPSGKPSGPTPLGDMIAKANLQGVEVVYRDAPGADPALTATIDGVASLDRGAVRVEMTATTNLPDSEPIKLTVTGTDVFDALGRLQVASAKIDASLEAAVGEEGLLALARRLQPEGEWPDAPAPGAGNDPEQARGLRASLGVKLENGRFALADPSKPSFVRARIAPELVRAAMGEQAVVDLREAPVATIAVTRLDIPLPDNGALPDMRGGSVKGYISTTAIEGAIALGAKPDDGQPPTPEPLRVDPLEINFGTEDFAQGLGAVGATNWTIGSNPAGRLSIDAKLSGLLDREGRWKVGVKQPNGKPGELEDLRVELIANSAPTAVFQPMIDDARLELRDLVGPLADVQVVMGLEPGASASSDAGRGKLVTIVAGGNHASLEADLIYADDRVASRGAGVRGQFTNVAATLRRFAGEDVVVTGDGMVLLRVPSFELPLVEGKIDPRLASAEVEAHLGDFSVARKGDAEAIQVRDLHNNITLTRSGPARLEVNYQLAHRGQDFGPRGAVTMADVFADNPASDMFDLRRAKFTGQIQSPGMPTSLLALALDDADARLAREALGDTADLVIRASGASAGTPGELASIEFAAASGASVTTTLRAETNRWAVGPTQGVVRLTPAMFAMADDRFEISRQVYDALAKPDASGAAPAGRLALGSSTLFDLSAQPIGLALGEQGLPTGERVGSLQAQLTARNPVDLSGIPNPVGDAGAAPIALQFRDLTVAASTHPQAPREDEQSVSMSVYEPDRSEPMITRLQAIIRKNEVPLEVRISGADAPAIDRVLGKPGMLDGALGSPVNLVAMREAPRDRGIEVLTASIDAPRLTGASVSLASAEQPARMGLVRPASLTWSPTNAWLERYVFGGSTEQAPVRIDGQVTVAAAINRLTLATGENGPMLPGVFDLDARVETAALPLITGNGVRETLRGVFATVTNGPSPGSIAVAFGANDAQGSRTIEGSGTIADLADAQGNIAADRARLSATVNGTAPTALVDAIYDQDGLLVDTLGPTSTIKLIAQDLSKAGGRLQSAFSSEYASVDLAGRVEEGVFVTEGEPRVELRIVTEAASKRLFEPIFPIVNTFRKSEKDTPGLITAANLRVPIDGDMRKLNGVIRCDLGTAQFRTASVLSPVMKAIKAREAGQIGQKVPPFDIRLENGVARYDEVALPIGEITMRTYGKVSLVNKKVEIIVMIPFASVSDDLAATIGRLPFVGDVAVVPIKIVGPMDAPRAEFDPELLVKNVIEKNPIGTIFDQIGGALDKKDDKKNDNKDKPKN